MTSLLTHDHKKMIRLNVKTIRPDSNARGVDTQSRIMHVLLDNYNAGSARHATKHAPRLLANEVDRRQRLGGFMAIFRVTLQLHCTYCLQRNPSGIRVLHTSSICSDTCMFIAKPKFVPTPTSVGISKWQWMNQWNRLWSR